MILVAGQIVDVRKPAVIAFTGMHELIERFG